MVVPEDDVDHPFGRRLFKNVAVAACRRAESEMRFRSTARPTFLLAYGERRVDDNCDDDQNDEK